MTQRTRQPLANVDFLSVCLQSRLNSDCLKSSPESELGKHAIAPCGAARSGRFIQIHFLPDEGSDVQWLRLTKPRALQTWCTRSGGTRLTTSARLMESSKFECYGWSFVTLQLMMALQQQGSGPDLFSLSGNIQPNCLSSKG